MSMAKIYLLNSRKYNSQINKIVVLLHFYMFTANEIYLKLFMAKLVYMFKQSEKI